MIELHTSGDGEAVSINPRFIVSVVAGRDGNGAIVDVAYGPAGSRFIVRESYTRVTDLLRIAGYRA